MQSRTIRTLVQLRRPSFRGRRWLPVQGAGAGDNQTAVVRRSNKMLAISVTMFVGGLFVVVVSWPLMDTLLIPWSMSRALFSVPTKEKQELPEGYRHRLAEYTVRIRAFLKAKMADDEFMSRSKRAVVVLSDDPIAEVALGNVVGELKAEGHPGYYASLTCATCPDTLFYGMIYQLFSHNSFVIAYVKFLNAAAMALTMNQGHEHSTFILFEQFLGQLRMAHSIVQGGPCSVTCLSGVDVPLHAMHSLPGKRKFSEMLGSLFLNLGTMASPQDNGLLIVSGDAATLLEQARPDAGDMCSHVLLSQTVLGNAIDVNSAEVLQILAASDVPADTLEYRYRDVLTKECSFVLGVPFLFSRHGWALEHLMHNMPRGQPVPLSTILNSPVPVRDTHQALLTLVALGLVKRVAGKSVYHEDGTSLPPPSGDIDYLLVI